MKTIWKYEIRPDSVRDGVHPITIDTKLDAVPLCVGLSNGVPAVWMEVDTDRAMGLYTFYSVGTGFGAVPSGVKYLGTIFEGPYVWHIYIKEQDAREASVQA